MSTPFSLRARRSAFVAITVIAVLCGMAPAAQATTGAGASAGAPDVAAAAVDTAKIDAKVLDTIDAGNESTFFVVMTKEADLDAAESEESHADRATATYDSLTTTAADTQESLQDSLDRAKVGYESFWITNALKITSGDRALVEEMAARSDVESIVAERIYPLEEVTQSSAAAVAAAAAAAADEVVEWGIAETRAPEVWSQYGDRGEGIVIANIDSGVQYNHPALVGTYRGNLGDGTFAHDYNWFDPTGQCANALPCDNNGHGTHTMGTMVAQEGIGMAPGATWIAAKGCESRSCSDSSLLAAGQWILAPTDRTGANPRPDLAPNIVNNSWGGSEDTTFYTEIIAAWNAAGIFDAFAAGNDGDGSTCSTANPPSTQEATYAVGAYDSAGAIASFSGFGPSRVDGSTKPNIAAPGVAVRSTYPTSAYRALNGTSMATPHVAGAVALIWAEAPSLIGDVAGTRELLSRTARDVDDTRCGGTAGMNNIWGEGKLDAMAAVDAAPHTSAIITGTVTDEATGAPISGATITATTTDFARTATSSGTGAFRITLPAGTYTFALSSYGYSDATQTGYEVTAGEDATVDFTLDAVPNHVVRGVVLDVAGAPLSGVTVALPGTPVPAVTTDSRGRYSFASVAEGSFTQTASPAAPIRCNGIYTGDLVVDGDENVTVPLPQRKDLAGNTCAPAKYSWVRGEKRVTMAGDENATTIALPFPVRFYDVNYTSAAITTNGLVNFLQPRLGDYANTALPSAAQPNGIVAAFWDDLVVDRHSKIETATDGKTGKRTFSVEWNDVALADDPSERVTFQVVFAEADGSITLQYQDIGRDAAERGTSATIGIESQSGADALQYSLNENVLADRTAIRFTPAGMPPAETAVDTDGRLVLTAEQEATLADRLQVDPYGDAAADAAADDPVAPEQDAAAEEAGVALATSSAIEGVDGMAETVEVGGANGDYFVVNAMGSLQRRTADGDVVWAHGNTELYQEWGVQPIRPWQPEAYPARIVMGFSSVTPFTPQSDQGFATGDLTGDGIDDIAFTASVGATPYRPFTSPGSSLTTGTFVSILDGATGDLMWSKLYASVLNVEVIGNTLLVADSPSFNQNAPAGSPAALTALRFTGDGDGLAAQVVWTREAGTAPGIGWGALLPVGQDKVAVSWNQRKTSLTSPASGHTLMLNAADGSVLWEATDRLYSRQLHLDADRGRLVALEQSDLNDGVEYAISAYSLTDGVMTRLDSRINAFPYDLAIGNVSGRKSAEYIVSESTLTPNLYINANTVWAIDGDDATRLWSRTVKRDPGNTADGGGAWGLHVLDGDVVASYQDDFGTDTAENRSKARFARLAVLDGDSGKVRWEQRGVVASQMWVQPIQTKHEWKLRTVDVDQNVWTYGLRSPARPDILPMQGRVWTSAAVDVNRDGTNDVIVGGQSRGVWAYDGTSLVDGDPELLWQAILPGQVQQIVAGDVDGDRKQEIVVAADTSTAIVDVRTGKVEKTISGDGQFVRSVAVNDLDRDGAQEIVVPTDAVRAYDHRGRLEWKYQAPRSAGQVVFSNVSFGDGQVYAQYVARGALDLDDPAAAGVALRAKNGSLAWSYDPAPQGSLDGTIAAVPLKAATFASPGIPYADGHAIVNTWQSAAGGNPLATFMEIRDGRTGALLRTQQTGGGYTLGNYFTSTAGLTQVTDGTLRTYGPNEEFYENTITAHIKTAAMATGPGERALVVAGGAGGLNVYDDSALTGGDFPPSLAGAGILGAQEFMIADLDADGQDEVVSLNYNELGADRMAELVGGAVVTPYSAIRQLTTLTIDPAE